MHGTRLTFRKAFVRKQYILNVLVFSIVSAKSVEVPIELSEDCYCDLSVPIQDEYTITEIKKNCKFLQNKKVRVPLAWLPVSLFDLSMILQS